MSRIFASAVVLLANNTDKPRETALERWAFGNPQLWETEPDAWKGCVKGKRARADGTVDWCLMPKNPIVLFEEGIDTNNPELCRRLLERYYEKDKRTLGTELAHQMALAIKSDDHRYVDIFLDTYKRYKRNDCKFELLVEQSSLQFTPEMLEYLKHLYADAKDLDYYVAQIKEHNLKKLLEFLLIVDAERVLQKIGGGGVDEALGWFIANSDFELAKVIETTLCHKVDDSAIECALLNVIKDKKDLAEYIKIFSKKYYSTTVSRVFECLRDEDKIPIEQTHAAREALEELHREWHREWKSQKTSRT